LLSLLFGCGGDDATCTGPQTSCGGACVDTSKDPANCGACGVACDTAKGETCNAGVCEGSCKAPKLSCGGACIDPQSDDANCGTCGTKCDLLAGLTCVAGKCACSGGKTACGTPPKCVDLAIDPANCGTCGTSCPAGSSCNNGSCGDCPPPKLSCSGACVDPQSDNGNCGTCGNACDTAAGFSCLSGTCACGGGKTACGTPPNCSDTNVDPKNCGACGKACAAGETCQAGTCGAPCLAPKKLCGTVCADLTSDSNNCSDCGIKCTGGKTCVAAACACAAGETDCSGTCADLSKDPSNCGACGTKCASGEVCTGTPPTCQPGCPAGQKACAGSCVTVATDPNNCTDCGIKCTGGKICNNGCTCGVGQTDCSGTCVDLTTDDKNCGACAKTCAAAETCQAGVCVPATFTGLQVSCASTNLPLSGKTQCTANGVLQAGTTVPLTSDPKLTWTVVIDPTSPVGCASLVPGSFSTTTRGELQIANNATLVALGCRALVSATYTGASQTLTSNVVTITIRDKKITSVAVTPASPTVPALACAKVNFRILVGYDSGELVPLTLLQSGESVTWLNLNPAIGTLVASGGGLLFSNSTPLVAGSAEIRATVILGGTTYNPSTTVTVVGGTLTSLAIVPKAPTAIPAGTSIAFTALATFNGTSQVDVTYWGPQTDPHVPLSGCALATFVHTSGTHLLPAAPTGSGTLTFDASTRKHSYVFTATSTPTGSGPPDVVTLTWNGQSDTANVTVSNASLVSCSLRIDNALPPTPSTLLDGTTWPKGLMKKKLYAIGSYSNGDYADITDSVVWSSDKPSVATVDNTAGAKGQTDMLLAGTATISANPSALNPAVAPCTAGITVVTAQVCKLYVLPRYRNDNPNEYRRAYRGAGAVDPHAASTNGPGLGDLNAIRPVLPNESGFVQRFRALAFYCTDAVCPAGSAWGPSALSLPPVGAAVPAHCYPVDVTAAATWATETATISPVLPVGLAPAGTPGVFTVVKDTAAASWRREDRVSATVPLAEGSATTVTTKLNVLVCGGAVANTAKLYSQFSDLVASTAAASKPKGEDGRYHLVSPFKAGTSVCDFATAPAGLTANGYLLDVSEEASTWTTTPAGVASVSTAPDSMGDLHGDAVGTTTVTSSFSGSSASLAFTVVDPVVSSCTLSPTAGALASDTSFSDAIQLAVTAVYSDGSTIDQTTAAATSYAVYDSPTGTTHTNLCASFSPTTKGRLVAATNVTSTCKQYLSVSIGSLRCTPCSTGDSNCSAPTDRPVITVEPAAVADYTLQVATLGCLEPVAVPTVSVNTSIVLKGCIKFTNGAIVEDLTGPSVWLSPQPTVLASDGKPETNWGRFKALGSAGPVTVQAQRVFPGTPPKTFNPTLAIPLSSAAITDVAITAANHKDVLPGSVCSQLGVQYEICEVSGSTQRYRVVGTRAGLPPQDLTHMAAITGSVGTCGANPWTQQAGYRGKGFFALGGVNCDSDLSATVTFVDGTAATTPAGSATVRIIGASIGGGLSLAIAPSSLSGAGAFARASATGAVLVGTLMVPVDLTLSTSFGASLPQALYLRSGLTPADRYERGRMVSRTVAATTPVQLAGDYLDLHTQLGQATVTLNP
jgi:hypothetical protein